MLADAKHHFDSGQRLTPRNTGGSCQIVPDVAQDAGARIGLTGNSCRLEHRLATRSQNSGAIDRMQDMRKDR